MDIDIDGATGGRLPLAAKNDMGDIGSNNINGETMTKSGVGMSAAETRKHPRHVTYVMEYGSSMTSTLVLFNSLQALAKYFLD